MEERFQRRAQTSRERERQQALEGSVVPNYGQILNAALARHFQGTTATPFNFYPNTHDSSR